MFLKVYWGLLRTFDIKDYKSNKVIIIINSSIHSDSKWSYCQ